MQPVSNIYACKKKHISHNAYFTDGYVKYMDLSVPQYLPKKFDWVLCLEVGEHLDSKYEKTLVENIARHAKKGAIVSWAVPGQGGHRHVNEKSNVDVIALFARYGLKYDAESSHTLRSMASLKWFKNTIMVFNT